MSNPLLVRSGSKNQPLQESDMTFYDKDMMSDFKKSQKKTEFEKLLIPAVILAGYFFLGFEVAVVIGVAMICYALVEIKLLLSYQNFMTGKGIGLHDI
jgi:hypothetical protein